jgi:hypothetical protein
MHAGETDCTNVQLAQSSSPGNTYSVVVFQRSCGATTGFSTQASLIRGKADRYDWAGNIFRADHAHDGCIGGPDGGPRVVVSWTSDQEVALTYDECARVFMAEHELDGVTISYVALD